MVDDDPGMRYSLQWLLQSAGLSVELFSTAEDFLERFDFNRSGCLLLDVRLPGMSGLDLQRHMFDKGVRLSLIMLTAYGDVPIAVRALKAGAIDFIEKPFIDERLIAAIRAALARDRHERRARRGAEAAAARMGLLTPRERDVLRCLVDGQSNKQIAGTLGISDKTVEVHRSSVMKKLQVDSVPALLHLVMLVNGGDAVTWLRR